MIEELISQFQTELKSNDFLVAGLGTTMATAALYQLRSLPNKLWQYMVMVSTSEITLASDENIEIFNSALKYFEGKNPFLRQARFSSIPTVDRWGESKNESTVGIGYGKHYYIIGGKPCIVSYSVDEKVKLNTEVRKVLSITMLARHPKSVFDDLLSSVVSSVETHEAVDVFVYGEYNDWNKVKGINPRPLHTVYIAQEKKDRIKKEINFFLGSRDSCIDRGIPWKLSFLLEGEAGTGKSSLALALATEFSLPLYIISMADLSSDTELMKAMRTVPQKSIVLIEDIDSQGVNMSRDKKDEAQNTKNQKVTMSGILNSIDGVTSPDGRILIMTTNHPDRLDPALIRAGRVDVRVNVGKLTYKDSRKMFENLTSGKLKLPPKKDLTGKTGAEIEVMVKSLESENA